VASLAQAIIRHNGPLYYFALRGWIALAGTSVTALRFFSAWAGVLCVPLGYLLGRRLLDQTTGLVLALLLATSPYLVWFSQDVKMYSLVLAMVLGAVYALRRAADGGGWRWWAVQMVLTGLVPYVHIWGALLVPVQVLLFLSWWPRSRHVWRGGASSLALLTLPYLPLGSWIVKQVFVERETGFPHYTLADMAQTLLTNWSTGRSGWGHLWGELLCLAMALLGLVVLLFWPDRSRGRRVAAGLLGWVLLPMLGIWFVSLWQPLFTDRYLIWAAPAFYLAIAAGLTAAGRGIRWLALPLLVAVMVLFSAGLLFQQVWTLKSDVRGAAAFVDQEYRPGDLLIFQIPHIRYTFDYYSSVDDFEWLDGPYTNYPTPDGDFEMNQQQADAYLDAVTLGYERVWLIASEMEMWDQRHLLQAWLDRSGTRIAQAAYLWVDVYLYRLEGRP
jgi:uncharacterized membrane protein